MSDETHVVAANHVVEGIMPNMAISNVNLALNGNTLTLSADLDPAAVAKIDKLLPFIKLILQFVK